MSARGKTNPLREARARSLIGRIPRERNPVSRTLAIRFLRFAVSRSRFERSVHRAREEQRRRSATSRKVLHIRLDVNWIRRVRGEDNNAIRIGSEPARDARWFFRALGGRSLQLQPARVPDNGGAWIQLQPEEQRTAFESEREIGKEREKRGAPCKGPKVQDRCTLEIR